MLERLVTLRPGDTAEITSKTLRLLAVLADIVTGRAPGVGTQIAVHPTAAAAEIFLEDKDALQDLLIAFMTVHQCPLVPTSSTECTHCAFAQLMCALMGGSQSGAGCASGQNCTLFWHT